MAILGSTTLTNSSGQVLSQTVGTLIKAETLEYSTRASVSNSSDGVLYTVSYTKILGATQSNLILKSDVRGRGPNSGVCGTYVAVAGTRNYSYSYLYDNNAQEIYMIRGVGVFTGVAAGSQTITVGWAPNNGSGGEAPFTVLNPDQGDGDGRFRKQTSRLTIWEVTI
jgi:hypothetical protein